MKGAPILVATDIASDADMVTALLRPKFKTTFVSTEADRAVADFEAHKPDVLILAFNTLEKAEAYHQSLYRLSAVVHTLPHRTIALCDKRELHRAYELCCSDQFDDYVLFWPMVHDAPRLSMAVVHALRDLERTKNAAPAAEMARHVRRIAELEGLLDVQLKHGQRLAAYAQHSMESTMTADIRPMVEWIEGLPLHLAPHLASAQDLHVLAERFQPVVLVVDDDAFERKLVDKLMEMELYEVIFASSGLQALSILRKEHPDLILMDMDMPEINGLETLRKLKASPEYANIPVMMVTSHSEREVVVECLRAGAIDFVVKPLDREIFLGKVAKFLAA